MYSNKENVNTLTALLVAHGIRRAVVCPGSRNAPIVHNLNECPDITCHPVTDERSAGFYALGMAQAEGRPVAVCVTSGTALLNLAPAVAEAYYQHQPLVVISADRPVQWIDQLDGQTLPQPDALGRFVRKAVTLPEFSAGDVESHWYCNRLINEALMVRNAPVHINVPIAEPLFEFTTELLPHERTITLSPAVLSQETLSEVALRFVTAERPMLVCGQPMNPNLDEAVFLVQDDERYVPDFVLYIGGSIVSKRLKHFLRKAKETWAVNETGEVNDTFMNLSRVIQGDGQQIIDHIHALLDDHPHPFVQQWEQLTAQIRCHVHALEVPYSQLAAVKCFETQRQEGIAHYANSTAIRLANICNAQHVRCNRGVNGIEGSLSTAAGYSLTTDEHVYCVIGDLSFFYDQNALWNQGLRGNLRILLLNNGRGGIFNLLKGLSESPACDKLVAAEHHTSAEGICRQNNVTYQKAENIQEMHSAIACLLTEASDRPMLLEVVTDAAEDERTFRDYYRSLKALPL